MFQQILAPVADSLALSALCAAVPLVTLFVLLGGLRMKAWIAGVISLVVSIVVAILFFEMPTDQALLAASEGAAFGFFPILWIVINAIWVYNLTVETGHFDVLRLSFSRVSPDHRIQAIIIAFCFGALLEALAGFGTPVAITVVMLLALGFAPIKAAAVALIANTAPVAYGALATPIVTLATVTSGVNDDPRLNIDTLGAMVGRQTPILAIIVPLVLVFVVDGMRGVRHTWLPAIVAGLSFGIAQFVASNYISVPLTDIVAALVGAAAVVLLLRFWQPAEDITTADMEHSAGHAQGSGEPPVGAVVGGAPGEQRADAGTGGTTGSGLTASGRPMPDAEHRTEVIKAYTPYLIIIAIFSVANIPAVKEALAEKPWTIPFQWPGLNVLNTAGDPLSSMTYNFNWFPAAGTLMIFAGILTAIVLKISPGRMLKQYGATYYELRWAIVTVMAVLALAYVMNMSGQTNTLGAFLAETGGLFVILSPILGWLGVAVTGSDTSANALFGALQVQTAAKAGLDPVLLAAANSSGGVLGKMVSPQNLAIAAAAVGMAGKEGDIFRKVMGWSFVLLVFMCVIVALQASPVLDWMVPTAP
ncbi:MAG TPA: L-lactate permease [Nocardioidaceae bacterium]|nr:L-lactate permease [Nocardioidaceae bacterium]